MKMYETLIIISEEAENDTNNSKLMHTVNLCVSNITEMRDSTASWI